MVHLVGHTLLNSTIGTDIDDIADLVLLKVCGQVDETLLTEVTAERVACARAKT